MNRALLLLTSKALLLAGCAPAPSTPAAKVDPTAEAWYGPATERLTSLDRTAEQLFQTGRTQEAASLVTSGQSLQSRLLSAPHPTLEAMEAIADLDQLYGRLLTNNGYWGQARLLFQKNVTRWKTWKPQTPETDQRLKQASDAIAECDRHMGA